MYHHYTYRQPLQYFTSVNVNGSVLTLPEINTQSDYDHDGHSIIVENVEIRHWSFNQNLIVEKR